MGQGVCIHQLVTTEHMDLLERLKGELREEEGQRDKAWRRASHPPLRTDVGRTTQQVHGQGGGSRWGSKGIHLVWTRTGSSKCDRFQEHSLMAGSLSGPLPPGPPAPPRPQPHPGLGVCELQVRAHLQMCRGGGVIALAPSFSTVYNLLLCLHIFSVHIIHQSKKRNYENLDQLSYDNKRGPKVYMHGRARHPPTREPWPLAPRPPGLFSGPAEPQA